MVPGSTLTLANNLAINTDPAFGDGSSGGQLVFEGTVFLRVKAAKL